MVKKPQYKGAMEKFLSKSELKESQKKGKYLKAYERV